MFYFLYVVLWPTNAQLFHKLSHFYMFRHYRVNLKELVISTLPSYNTILYCITNSSRRMRWAVHVARMGEGRSVHRVLVGKLEGKRPLGRPRRRWVYNIKMDLQEVGGSCGDWMELAQDRDSWRALVRTVRNLRVPKMRGISWLAAEPVRFSRRTLFHGVNK